MIPTEPGFGPPTPRLGAAGKRTGKQQNLVAGLLLALMLGGCGGGGGGAEAPPPSPPVATPPPTPVNMPGSAAITGTATIGETLTAMPTDADGLSNATITYQWLSDGADIDGATGSSYTLTGDDVGKMIQVRIVYTDDAGFLEELLSAATTAIADAPNRPGRALLSGDAQVGETLLATVTDSDGITGSTLVFEWLADGVVISGASESSLALTAALQGALVQARVTYTDDRGFDETLLSSPTPPIAAAPVAGGGNFPRGSLGANDTVPPVTCDTVATSTQSLESLTSRSMTPGTTICLADGSYTDLDLDYGGQGTEAAPITVAAENPGMATIGGELSIRMSGSYVVLQGLIFRDGTSEGGDDLLQTRSGSRDPCNHCRVTEISIIDIDDRNAQENKWVSIYGQFTRVDHSWFSGKTNEGALLVVWRSVESGQDPADTEIDYAQIDHNYFGNRAPADGKPYPTSGDNGYEAIRVGTSDSHSADSLSVVEYNYFERIDGEAEVISNKSGNNTLFGNTIRDSYGALTLRHGSSATVSNNYIIGDDHPWTSGIRVIDDGHRIVNNYIEGVRYTATRFHGGIVLHGSDGSTSNGYQILENVFVAHNTVVDSINSLSVNAGDGSIDPEDVRFVNNIIADAIGPIIVQADEGLPPNSVYAGNYVFGETFSDDDGLSSATGFNVVDAALERDALGIWRPSASSPPLSADTTFDAGGFAAVLDDMDGQPRMAATRSGADEDASTATPTIGVLTAEDVGPISYRPPITPGTVVRFPIANHDFDEGMNGWSFESGAGLTTDAGEVYSRGTSASLGSTGARISQTLSVAANTNYTLSAYTMDDIRLGAVIDGVSDGFEEDNSNYRFTQYSFTTGNVTEVTIFAESTSGEAFIDSVRLISHAVARSN